MNPGDVPPPDDDEPLTLAEACELIFRNTIKPATLMAEAARGRLVIEKIGRKNYVTRAGIKAMRRLCEIRVEPARTVDDAEQVQQAYEAARASVARLGELGDRKTPRRK